MGKSFIPLVAFLLLLGCLQPAWEQAGEPIVKELDVTLESGDVKLLVGTAELHPDRAIVETQLGKSASFKWETLVVISVAVETSRVEERLVPIHLFLEYDCGRGIEKSRGKSVRFSISSERPSRGKIGFVFPKTCRDVRLVVEFQEPGEIFRTHLFFSGAE